MLVAEIHGKVVPEAQNHEDSLTSAIFGHLRYIPPTIFWSELFSRAKNLPDVEGREESLMDSISRESAARSLENYSSLRAYFWSKHRQWGEPDLLLHFSGVGPPLLVLIEIKLWSGKSGENEEDQLARYLNVLDDLSWLESLGVKAPIEDSKRYLVYLTPRETIGDVRASLATLPVEKQDQASQRLFRMRWQDLGDIARRVAPTAPEPAKTILADAARFLHVRGLEPFDGFKRIPNLAVLSLAIGHFYSSPSRNFYGWSEPITLENLAVLPAPWNRTPSP